MNINELINKPVEQRDHQWENQFFNSLINSKLTLMSPDPQLGPDQWPYLLVQTDDEGTESTSKIVTWLADKGVGMVVNAHKDYPDYVFSYGMIWSFKETGLFFRRDQTVNDGKEAGQVDYSAQKIHSAGNPSAEYLPATARKILCEFFRDQGVLKVKTLVLSVDGKQYDLCFSLESLGNPPASEHAGIAEAISWFLPPHYAIVLISEKELPAFFDL